MTSSTSNGLGYDPQVPIPVRRWVGWALLLLGVGEVFWVIYLMFNQARAVRVFHLHAVTLGVGGVTTVVAACAAVALIRESRAAAWLAISTATLIGFMGAFVGLSRADYHAGIGHALTEVVALGGIGTCLAAATAYLLLSQRGVGRYRHWLALGMVGVAAGMLIRMGVALGSASTQTVIHARAIVVVLDTGETAALICAGIGVLRQRVRLTYVAGTIAATLLLLDALTNLLVVPSGPAFQAALFYLIVGELPSTAVAIIAARAAGTALPAKL